MDDNDLDEMPDFDASVSTINSDCERVDSVLIKKILSEMKSEFTRGTAGSVNETEDKCDSFDESPELYDIDKKGNGIQNNVSGLNTLEDSESRDSNTHDESNENSVVDSKTTDDIENSPPAEKPRIIITLRTNEEDRENGSKFVKSNQVSSENLSDISDNSSVINHSNDASNQLQENPVVAKKQTLLEGRGKRNLRSRLSNPEKDVEQSGLKRSSRRFSKEYGRESVLQNAIARKEKSFNSLNPSSEDRSYRRGARSPRHGHIPNEVKQTKSNRNKSPKQLAAEKAKAHNCSTSESSTPASTPVRSENERPDSTTTLDLNKETDLLLGRLKNENDALTDDSNENINLNRHNAVGVDSEKTPSKVKNNPLYYTKTGKRRSRYFKGLKYSLTGGSVRKKALALARKGLRKTAAAKENAPVEVKEESQPPKEEEPQVAEMPADEGLETNGEIRSPSPAIAEACHSNALKRKSQPDLSDPEEGVAEKRKCEDVAVPSSEDTEPDVEPEKHSCEDVPSTTSPGEVDLGLEKAESTIITAGVGKAGLCHCNKLVEIYASPASCRAELYCQAVDSLDGRLIGCCNTVDKNNARLVRPSIKVPFLVLCEVHHERLQRHNCCPGCGNFCTQGKFMQCCAYHQYHADCRLMEEDDSKPACPHCGTDSAIEVNISLGAHKYPVFLPLQKPSKELPSAKMSFSGVKTSEGSEKGSSTPPLVPPAALLLPSGLQISAEGLPPSIDKDKLENLLHVACSINSDSAPQPRYGIRNMYQAAKAGDAEKMIYMLASGLNPNHIFREWGMGSALHAASSCGHLAVVHLLVQAGANTDILDREQNTPLMLAASSSHNQIVKYLVKAGASVTFKGGDGMTALHLAAKSGNVEACYYLVSNPNTPHSYIDTVDDGRWTPLVWAAEHCHTEVVRFLLERRADPLVRDAEQNIALHWAALAGSVDIAEALLNYGSDVNSTNAHGDTPLHIAARQNAYECVVLLLARGARVDSHNRAGFMPLDCCIVAPSDTYTAIKLNVELRALTLSLNKRANRILTNDITRGHEANPIQCVNSHDVEPEPQDFVYITENCFTSNISIDRTITSLQSCKCRDMCSGGGCMCGKISIRCWYDDEGKLLPDFNFADPPMLFECNQACMCNRLMCKNRVVQHGITARFQLFRTKGNKGWGVSTLRLIPKGAYVCEYIGEIISDCEADTREDDSYLFDLDNRDGETYCIDARRYGNIARFINHSCVPNLLPVRVFIDHQDLHFPRIAFFANRDIQVNEELGFDYGEKFWIIKYKSFTCTCGAENCRYSEHTIEQTLDNYNKKLQHEESP